MLPPQRSTDPVVVSVRCSNAEHDQAKLFHFLEVVMEEGNGRTCSCVSVCRLPLLRLRANRWNDACCPLVRGTQGLSSTAWLRRMTRRRHACGPCVSKLPLGLPQQVRPCCGRTRRLCAWAMDRG